MILTALNINLIFFKFFASFVLILMVVVCVAFFTLLERKVLGGIQRRRGPNFVGFWGLLQAFSDALKLILKEISVPSGANFFFFMLSPIMILTLSLTLWAVIPFSYESAACNLNYSLFFIFIISTLNVYNLILAGMSSNSRYALLGGVRSAAQMISYEIPMSISLIGIGLISGTFNLSNIIAIERGLLNIALALPFFIVFFVCAFAETNRTPFDLPEAEAEIVAGYNVEYSSILFAFFFLAEYSNIMFISFFIVFLFFGAYSSLVFFVSAVLVMLIFIAVRGILPRYKYSQLMDICWKFLFPAVLGYFYFVAAICFFFKFTPNAGYDDVILDVAKSLSKGDGAKLRLEGSMLEFWRTLIENLLHKNRVFSGAFLTNYGSLFIFFLAALVFSVLLTLITWIFIPKVRSNPKNSSYECGYEPIGAPTARFEVHFYIIAILFIIFDVEILFLYPWAIGLGRLPFEAFFAMTLFIVILLVGFTYEWLRGALNWEVLNYEKNNTLI